MDFRPPQMVSIAKWFRIHEGHHKVRGETVDEYFVYKLGQTVPCGKGIFVWIHCRCEDCNQVLFFDTYQEQVRL